MAKVDKVENTDSVVEKKVEKKADKKSKFHRNRWWC